MNVLLEDQLLSLVVAEYSRTIIHTHLAIGCIDSRCSVWKLEEWRDADDAAAVRVAPRSLLCGRYIMWIDVKDMDIA